MTDTNHDPYEGMSTDRAYLEDLADQLESSQDDNIAALAKEHARKLRAIAIGCDQLMLEKQRLLQLEERVDQKLCKLAETWLQDESNDPSVSPFADHTMALWLLARRTKESGTRAMIGGGLGSLGAALLGNMAKGIGKTP